MKLYIWAANAWSNNNFLAEHTWVTDYDMRPNAYRNINDVINANNCFWYCHGDFKSFTPQIKLINICQNYFNHNIVVTPNSKKAYGSIIQYGIDGVCHQLTNQVLYPAKNKNGFGCMTANGARGYKLSSAIYGTYGRRSRYWMRLTSGSRVKPYSHFNQMSLLVSRAKSAFKGLSFNGLMNLEHARRNLLSTIDSIGYLSGQSKNDRVNLINTEIIKFLGYAKYIMQNEIAYERVFGIKYDEEILLVDPDLFVIPDDKKPPKRNSIEGW